MTKPLALMRLRQRNRKMIYKAKIKSRDKASQTTGYKRITEWQFIITIIDGKNFRVEIVGRWFPAKKNARKAAENIARMLLVDIKWEKAGA